MLVHLLIAAAALTPAASPPADAEIDGLLTALRVPAAQRSDWTTFRIGGDLFAAVDVRSDSDMSAGPCRLDTPLPQGYPLPTPPGAVELKRYPNARRAEYAAEGNSDIGKNVAFWPLFAHIKKHDIAMTSPVEVDYPSRAAVVEGKPRDQADRRWVMSFLYRTPDMNTAGKDGMVTVADAPPITVISLGVRGPYSERAMDDALNTLMAELARQPDWRISGAPRALYYNGPSIRPRDQWSEIQIPIAPFPPR